MVAAMKGVAYTLEHPDFRSDDYAALHPFQRIPAMTHGEVHLYETLAIGIYIDQAFEGSALQPEGAVALGQMFQWISILNDYAYEQIVRRCVQEHFVKPMRGLEPDRERIAAAKPEMARVVDVLDRALGKSPYLVGDSATLAEAFWAPVMTYFSATPEGKEILPGAANVAAWMERMKGLPDFATINAMGPPR